MATGCFKDTILGLLSASTYNLKLKNDQLSSFESQKHLQPFFDWFVLNVTKENCVTFNELEEFKKLQENGDVLYGEELDTALDTYHDQSVGSLVPYTGSLNDTLCDELTHLKEQLSLKQTLQKSLSNSKSSVQDAMCGIHNNLRKAEAEQINVLKNVFALNKMFNAKLVEVDETLCKLQEDLSELDVGTEISADEGIDTLMSDTLHTSTTSISSTLSLQSTCSTKISHKKYLCQLSLHDHAKQQKQFSRLMEGIMHKLNKYMKKCGKIDKETVEPDLEMKYIMDRLYLQKQSHIKSLATIEGITAALNKVKEYKNELHNGTWNTTLARIRKSADSEAINNFEESFDREVDDLSEACEKWAEFQTLKPVLDKLEENIECSNHLIGKMNEIIEALKTKVAADAVLTDVLLLEVERVSGCVELYTTLQEMIKQRHEAAKERLEVMKANCQDYADYCSLPVEERIELIEWLAAMMGTEKSSVVEATIALTRNPQQRLQLLCQHSYRQIQTINSVEHNLKEFYNKEILNPVEQSRSNPDLLMIIQRALDDLSSEILNTIIYCRSLKENGESEEESVVQEMLKKLVNNSK